MVDKNEMYKLQALAEWKRQLENNEGIPAMYRKMFPENTEFWDKIIEKYVKEVAWLGFSAKDNFSGVTEKDIEKTVNDLKNRPSGYKEDKK